MKRIALAAGLAIFASHGASAQSADQLVKGATDTANVLNYGMGYNLQRFSPLTQINKDNAKNLVPVWNYSFADDRSEESQPLVYQGVLYVTTHNATMAVDAKTGKQIWKSKIDYPAETPRVVCCGIINRGAALFDGKVFRTTLDANVIALDAKTGKELWRQKAADIKEGYSMTVAPLVADGVVITGISGAEFGTRGFIDGWDPATGKHLWRTHTVPTPDEPGGDTWKGDTWKLGGGSTWITGSYDPEQNTVFWGVGNPGPFNAAVRPGDNLYTCSVLALDPKTGKMKWHFQFSPNNPFDYDAVAEMVLADMNVEGKPTKVLMNANRNGFFYVLDRSNGKLLAANPYVKVNWASSIDLKTGKPVETDVTRDAREGKKVTVYPSILGGKNWQPMSFNPQTGLAYANTLVFGGHYKTEPATYKAGEWYLGMDLTDLWDWPEGPRGQLKAIDPMTGKTKWEQPSDIPRFSGVLSTAGGVVFSGKLTGEFEAFDADSGKKLWQFQTGSGIEGQPVTWQQDGVQYVAVTSGYGGVYSLFSGDERLANVPAGGSLWVFAVKN
ncbi:MULTISPECIES: methanol/ethanol family PQQ-dependent dehydrogenase [Bradyrhizobium]|jgi:alcohol dehydrogenase (cytochrome c)|uniref:Methanol/ethanol family PQQ-dependent dehydrogenase n=4 Tax=Bradyrhizobium TaxID=374 RepID=A0ABS5G7T4_9BRAD|nr:MULTISPECIES: methanol/ethanol family PQQ-dependent dehydrogenase [Bradyrhizobium]RTL94081.1 MAG: PQQ-dependent dehydrogenase, methanol/ethanol family [Bradyrhizobiaceae bacterium]ABQ37903.1 Putative Quinoprotein ethanol dehydrogenase [Bradyrhizobium sp. BTAi1]MBR1137389.1 methanol/ethanol family PQQ-dependent dehydrogenase [Bradyrhizobium denitrificans]MCL8488236.1 methanol/ethanol family PQQ-dependent dehydrogenase [Bradyrhizobium denitrificans]MDU1491550.1 methanol/ethanol family PQQ-dep